MNNFFDYVFPVFFGLMFLIVFGSFVGGAYVTYECYKQGPGSNACYLVNSTNVRIEEVR